MGHESQHSCGLQLCSHLINNQMRAYRIAPSPAALGLGPRAEGVKPAGAGPDVEEPRRWGRHPDARCHPPGPWWQMGSVAGGIIGPSRPASTSTHGSNGIMRQKGGHGPEPIDIPTQRLPEGRSIDSSCWLSGSKPTVAAKTWPAVLCAETDRGDLLAVPFPLPAAPPAWRPAPCSRITSSDRQDSTLFLPEPLGPNPPISCPVFPEIVWKVDQRYRSSTVGSD